jgi:hypothetical protein
LQRELATAGASWKDALVPNKHRAAFSTNPDADTLFERVSEGAVELGGRVVDFDFDERKGLAFVTIETPDEKTLRFADVAKLADDPDGIYWIGPLNVLVPEGAEAS